MGREKKRNKKNKKKIQPKTKREHSQLLVFFLCHVSVFFLFFWSEKLYEKERLSLPEFTFQVTGASTMLVIPMQMEDAGDIAPTKLTSISETIPEMGDTNFVPNKENCDETNILVSEEIPPAKPKLSQLTLNEESNENIPSPLPFNTPPRNNFTFSSSGTPSRTFPRQGRQPAFDFSCATPPTKRKGSTSPWTTNAHEKKLEVCLCYSISNTFFWQP